MAVLKKSKAKTGPRARPILAVEQKRKGPAKLQELAG